VSKKPYQKITEVGVQVTVADKATVALVDIDPPIHVKHEIDLFPEDSYSAGGLALKGPGDTFNQEVGEKLAVGRALVNLGNRLIREANGKVKHHDDMREQKKRQAEAREVKRAEAAEAALAVRECIPLMETVATNLEKKASIR
jgi:hypothetical protein